MRKLSVGMRSGGTSPVQWAKGRAHVFVLGGVLALAAGAAAATGPVYNVDVALPQLNADGSGTLVAFPSDGWSWQACQGAAGNGCTPFAFGDMINTGGAPAGTVFVGTASDGSTITSPVWEGDVVSTVPPSVSGAVRANSLITPVRGQWRGGWAGAGSNPTQLAACANADGTDCTSLTDLHYQSAAGCPVGATVIDPVFTGWYLRIADAKAVPQVAPVPLILIRAFSPYGHPVWPANAVTAVAVVGQIAPAAGLATSNCGAPPLPPTATPSDPSYCLDSQAPPSCAVAVIERSGEVRTWCAFSVCKLTIDAQRAHTTIRYTTAAHLVTRTRLPRRLLMRLGGGRVRITVSAFGKRLASRSVTVPRLVRRKNARNPRPRRAATTSEK